MELKGIEGRATLGGDTITLIFDSKLALEKKAASPHAIPLKHVLEIDFAAPTTWKPGHLRIIMRDGQERAKLHSDLYALQLGAGRRLKEAQEFVAKLRAAVDAVGYEAPELPAVQIKTFEEKKAELMKELAEIKAESKERNARIKAEFEESDAGTRSKSFREINAELIAGLKEANATYDDARKSNASFRGIRLAGRTIRKDGKSWAANECEIIIDTGANVSSRVTGTRVAAGALIAGPVGALIGSIAQKDRSAVFLTLITPDDMFIEKVSGLEEAKAREFATRVKRAGMLQTREAAETAQADAAALAASVPAPPPPQSSQQQGIPAGWYPRGNVQQYWDGSAWTNHTAPLV